MSEYEMSNEGVPLEMRISHLEQMVDLFGRHTEIHMRSSVQKEEQIAFLMSQFAELQKAFGDLHQQFVQLFAMLPQPGGANL